MIRMSAEGQLADQARRQSLSGAVYRHALEEYADGARSLSANSVARELRISPNTVSLAVRALSAIGAASVSRRSFSITDFRKALMYWAATRKLGRSVAYSTFVGIGAQALEAKMPGGTALTAYSGYASMFGNDVADYGEVYVYATEDAAAELSRRFPMKKLSARSDYADLVVLRPAKPLEELMAGGSPDGSAVPMTQLCVDLWNISGWQAPRFFSRAMERLEARIREHAGV